MTNIINFDTYLSTTISKLERAKIRDKLKLKTNLTSLKLTKDLEQTKILRKLALQRKEKYLEFKENTILLKLNTLW